MPDIRIKDLTTTASSTASDDFFAADGTTNGTRKLSAFSPTFGGNATVGGTLTVSGGIVSLASSSTALTSVSSSTSGATGYNQASFTLDSNGTPKTAVLGVQDTGAFFGSNTNHNVTIRTNLTDRITVSNAGVVSISSTTASTSTSSGALVVSGGVGVAGSITLGGGVNIAGAASDPLPAGTSGVWTASGSGLRINSAGYTFASLTGTSVSDAKWTLNATTASSSTSSGALVVGNGTSGGLGVGGAANVGGLVKGAQNTYSDTNVPTGLSAGFQVDVQNATTRDIITFGDGTRHGLIRGYHDGAGTINWRFGRYTASTFAEYVRIAGLAAADAVVSIFGTTASTGTSSGALVVSGGVGVAGAIYAGGYVSTGTHARIGAQSSVVAFSANNNVDGGLPAAWTGNYGVGVQYLGSSSNAFFIGDGSGGSTYFYTRMGSANTARLSIDNTNGNVTIGGTLQVGNAYVGGAPTATGYIVIKDSTGTSYKIPAVAL